MTVRTIGTPGRYARWTWLGASRMTRSARAPCCRVPTSKRWRARADPAVADHTASARVIRIAVPATAITTGIVVVKLVPVVHSVASATVEREAGSSGAFGPDERVERSAK